MLWSWSHGWAQNLFLSQLHAGSKLVPTFPLQRRPDAGAASVHWNLQLGLQTSFAAARGAASLCNGRETLFPPAASVQRRETVPVESQRGHYVKRQALLLLLLL